MPKKSDDPKKIRNMRFTDKEWEALRGYADEMGTTRTGVIEKWIQTLVPPMYFPTEEPPEQQMRIFDFDADVVPTKKKGE